MINHQQIKVTKRLKIEISGIVQGVGFRPTVYRYALENKLSGHVLNSIKGVTIEIQGQEEQLNRFVNQLQSYPPKASIIEDFQTHIIEERESELNFQILYSKSSDGLKTAGISPDLATCDDCLKDIFSSENHRFQYAFTNCTNCGPRFTIIEDRPYDRPLTSMKHFPMCPSCMKEYNEPMDRRFHAQPNACPKCGPSLKLILNEKNHSEKNPLSEVIELLKDGALGAIKGLGGFHFAGDPFNRNTLDRLRKSKNRPNKSFALMMRDINEVEKYCFVSEYEKAALLHSSAPIVLLRRKNGILQHLSPDNNYLGVFLPYTPLHHLLLHKIPCLLMTSANRRDEPLAIKDKDVIKFIDTGIIDFILTHDRDIKHRCDDTIIQFHDDTRQFIRRSRGFVPNPILVNSKSSNNSLSYGSNMKNAFALRQKNKIYLSQHIGDLTEYRNLLYQEEEIKDFSRLLDIKIQEERCDSHPSYENYLENAKHIFHHHSHMLSVLAENDLGDSNVIGVICDGTGFGTDGAIWGFEFLQNDSINKSFKRLAHLDYFPLPGGEIAIKEIDRIAIALCENPVDLPYSTDRINSISQLIASGINTPMTSSLGRLFDGVAALTGLIETVEYEARGAILLQREAENLKIIPTERYESIITNTEGPITINFKSLIREIRTDISLDKSTSLIAWKFHKWIARTILLVLKNFSTPKIVLSGGCFQNLLLTSMVKEELHNNGYHFYFNTIVPPNDGGIALGQAFL